jgi:uncharacterized membrane protein
VSYPVFRFATVSPQAIDWNLKRNCSITPIQMAWLYGSLCLVSLLIGSGFWLLGATLVMPFVGLELLALGLALFVFARHATDGERIVLQGQQLVVELENAGRLVRAEFNRDWVRVEPKSGDKSLIELSGQGQKIEVGRYVRLELRPVLARKIRAALRQTGVGQSSDAKFGQV